MANHRYDKLRPVFGGWWSEVNEERADMARLRRVSTFATDLGPRLDVATALTIESFRTLYRRVPLDDNGSQHESLVLAAATLAHVREDMPGGQTAHLLGGGKDDRRVMAEPRFLRLMRVRTPAELMDEGRRVAALLNNRAPVADLGASLMVWLDDPERRRRWAQAYYGLGAPPSSSETASAPQPESGALQS